MLVSSACFEAAFLGAADHVRASSREWGTRCNSTKAVFGDRYVADHVVVSTHGEVFCAKVNLIPLRMAVFLH